MTKFNIALDGPAGAGKSTVARLVADALGFIYVDTGAMYRAVTWKVLNLGLSPADSERIAAAARSMRIELAPGANGQQVFVDGEDVTEAIRSREVTRNVSLIARIPEVRELMVARQKEMAANKGVVMDGRDIGTTVLPDAEVKIFLTASAEERAKRRLAEMNDESVTLERLQREIEERDRLDSQRAVSPLVQAEDAVLLDTTGMPLDEVVKRVLDLCRAKTSGGR